MLVSAVVLAIGLATGRGGNLTVIAAVVSLTSGALYFTRRRQG